MMRSNEIVEFFTLPTKEQVLAIGIDGTLTSGDNLAVLPFPLPQSEAQNAAS
jgi:hypothetical protein